MWATLCFLFYEQEKDSGEQAADDAFPFYSNDDTFGHGFFFAGSFLSHVMKHHQSYGFLDCGEVVVRVHLECLGKHQVKVQQSVVGERAEQGAQNIPETDEIDTLSSPVAYFVDNVLAGRQLLMETDMYFNALSERAKKEFQNNESADGGSREYVHGGSRRNIELYHPPREILL